MPQQLGEHSERLVGEILVDEGPLSGQRFRWGRRPLLLEDGLWPSWEQTFPSTLPTAASSRLKSASGPTRSCSALDNWWLTQLLAGGLKILVTHSSRPRNRQ